MSSEIHITAHQTSGQSKLIQIDQPPQECPQCHRGQRPVSVNAHFLPSTPRNGYRRLESVYRCTFADCEVTFIAYYVVSGNNARYVRSQPEKPETKTWEEAITSVSPDFVEIYDQARQAEIYDLGKIAGPGYRKALEFLLKDWLIANKLDVAKTIETKQLSKCIEDYIDEEHIKAVAARAAWLGNDETHYFRRWTEKDIQDLKKLIEVTANWINIRELSASVVKEMPGKK